jgi:hypothetical protein
MLRRNMPQDELRYKYIELGMSMKALSKEYKCDIGTIRRNFKECGISSKCVRNITLDPRRKFSDAESLAHEYYGLSMSVKEIAEKHDCHTSTVIKALKKFSIPNKAHYVVANISEQYLRDQYCIQKISCSVIAKEYECDTASIRNLLIKYNIPRHNSKDYPHVGIASSNRMKAYHQRVNTSGENNTFYGRKHTPETIAKIKTARAKQIFTPDQLAARVRGLRASWARLQGADRDKRVKAIMLGNYRKPNKAEDYLLSLLNFVSPNEWKYVGNGEIIIGSRNPDFININGKKQIVELFGDYWHSKEVTGREEADDISLREEIYSGYGYKTLVIWERELKSQEKVLERIAEFMK